MQPRHFQSFDDAFQDLTQLLPALIPSDREWKAADIQSLLVKKGKEIPHVPYQALLNQYKEDLVKGILTVFSEEFVITELNTPTLRRMIQHLCNWRGGITAYYLFIQLPHKKEKDVATMTFIENLDFKDFYPPYSKNPLYLAVYYDIAPEWIGNMIEKGAKDDTNSDNSAWMLALMTGNVEAAVRLLRMPTVLSNMNYSRPLDGMRMLENDYISLTLPSSTFFPQENDVDNVIDVHCSVGYRTFLEAQHIIETRHKQAALAYTAQDKEVFLSLMRAKLWSANTVKECNQIWNTYHDSACINYNRHYVTGYYKSHTTSLLKFLELVQYRMTYLLAQQWQDKLYPPGADNPEDNNYINPEIITPKWASKEDLKQLVNRNSILELMRPEGPEKGQVTLVRIPFTERVNITYIKERNGKKLLSDKLAIKNVEEFMKLAKPDPKQLKYIFEACKRRDIDVFLFKYALEHWPIKDCIKFYQFSLGTLAQVRIEISESIQDGERFPCMIPNAEGELEEITKTRALELKVKLFKIMNVLEVNILEANGLAYNYSPNDGFDILECIQEQLPRLETADQVLKLYRYCEKFKCLNTKHTYVYDEKTQTPHLAWLALNRIKVLEPLYPADILVTTFKDLFVNPTIRNTFALKADVKAKLVLDEKKAQSDYSTEDKAAYLILLKAQLKKAKTVADILDVYKNNIDAHCMKYHRHYLVGYMKDYTQTKIEFIHLVQYYLTLNLVRNFVFASSPSARNAALTKITKVLNHPVFSQANIEKGLSSTYKNTLAVLSSSGGSKNFNMVYHLSQGAYFFPSTMPDSESIRYSLHLNYKSYMADLIKVGAYNVYKERAKALGHKEAFANIKEEYRQDNFVYEMKFFYDSRLVLTERDKVNIELACPRIKKANSSEMFLQMRKLVYQNILNPEKDMVSHALLGFQGKTCYAEAANGVYISTLLKSLYRAVQKPGDDMFKKLLEKMGSVSDDVDFLTLKFALHHCDDKLCAFLLKHYDNDLLEIFKRELDESIIDKNEFPCCIPDIQGNLQEVDANLIKLKFYRSLMQLPIKPNRSELEKQYVNIFIPQDNVNNDLEEKAHHMPQGNGVLVSNSNSTSSVWTGIYNYFRSAPVATVQYIEKKEEIVSQGQNKI